MYAGLAEEFIKDFFVFQLLDQFGGHLVNAGADGRFDCGLDWLLADKVNKLGSVDPSIEEVLVHKKDANMEVKYRLLDLRIGTWVKACH